MDSGGGKTICCGLEVHIEGSFRPPETEEERELVVREFEKLLDWGVELTDYFRGFV